MKKRPSTTSSPFAETMRSSLVRIFLRAFHERAEIRAVLARFPNTAISLVVSAESVDRADRCIDWEVVFDRRSKVIRVTDFAMYRENASCVVISPRASLAPALSMILTSLDALAAVAEEEVAMK